MTPSLSELLTDFAIGLRYEDIPESVLEATKLHLLDALGCGLAAHGLSVGGAAQALAPAVDERRGATIIGRAALATPSDAALANGMLCHALDFDDTHGGSICHVSVVSVPALLAVAEAHDQSGRDLLTALVAANEVIARIGAAAAPGYMVRGFHPTSVCGVFGAAIGAARLLSADRRDAVSALGIAGSMAGGLFAYLADGTSTKPIHAGWAASTGIQAASLARHGAEGPRSVFEDRFGFFASYYDGGDETLTERAQDLGERWETLAIAFKAYPSCHFIHGALDAAAYLQLEAGWSPGEIESIDVAIPNPGVPLVLEPREAKIAPRTEYDAKFSLPYSVASMLVHGRVDLSTYLPTALTDPDVLSLARRVQCVTRDFPTYPNAFPAWVRLVGGDGRSVECERPYQLGAGENPMSQDSVIEKFRSNAALALRPQQLGDLEDAVFALDDAEDLRSSTRMLSAEPMPEVAA